MRRGESDRTAADRDGLERVPVLVARAKRPARWRHSRPRSSCPVRASSTRRLGVPGSRDQSLRRRRSASRAAARCGGRGRRGGRPLRNGCRVDLLRKRWCWSRSLSTSVRAPRPRRRASRRRPGTAAWTEAVPADHGRAGRALELVPRREILRERARGDFLDELHVREPAAHRRRPCPFAPSPACRRAPGSDRARGRPLTPGERLWAGAAVDGVGPRSAPSTLVIALRAAAEARAWIDCPGVDRVRSAKPPATVRTGWPNAVADQRPCRAPRRQRAAWKILRVVQAPSTAHAVKTSATALAPRARRRQLAAPAVLAPLGTS